MDKIISRLHPYLFKTNKLHNIRKTFKIILLSFTLKHIYIPPTCFDRHTGSSSGSMHYIESEVTKTSYLYRLSGSMNIQVMSMVSGLCLSHPMDALDGDRNM